MKIAVDTNVLVRYLTVDDESQAAAATGAIEGAEAVRISTIVLCELAWVLKRAYRYRNGEIADAIRRLVESRDVDTDRPAAAAGLRMLSRGGDFADGVIQFDAERSKCSRLVTFDRNLARLLDRNQVTLLPAARPGS